MKLFKEIAIFGVGLIGGSIGLAIKRRQIADKVIGIGRHKESIDEALRQGAIDEGSLDIERAKDAGLLILAAPVKGIINVIAQLPKIIRRDCIVIDVGSTKTEIVKAAQNYGLNFIGCHPLAGREKRGVEYSMPDIFKNSLCLIVPSRKAEKEGVEKIKRFWKELGARTELMDAGAHDRALAFVSHLPHLVAYSLIDCISARYLRFAASGLKDTTRIGLSDPFLWRDIFLTNRKEILAAIKDFKASLGCFELLIKNNQPKALAAYLAKSRNKRNAIAP